MKLRRCICFILLCIGFASGCSSEPDSQAMKSIAPQAVACNPTNEVAQIDEVLAGTDVVSFSTFKVAKLIPSGIYRIEMGGAVSSLTVVQKNGAWQLTRSFSERGLAILKKTYSLACIDDNQFQGAGITGIATSNGLLVLEEKSEGEGIPGDLWILYSASK